MTGRPARRAINRRPKTYRPRRKQPAAAFKTARKSQPEKTKVAPAAAAKGGRALWQERRGAATQTCQLHSRRGADLVENCIACHNPRKSESKYVMTTFTQLAKGGQQGEGITLEPGKPDESNLVEVIGPEGKPRMPYKQDPLLARRRSPPSCAGSQRGPSTMGSRRAKTGPILLRKTQQVTIPDDVSGDGADHGA